MPATGFKEPFDYKRFIVLVVDDEPKILKSFTRAFQDQFRIVTATSAAEGIELLEQHQDEVGLLIADQRMPGRKGVWVLEQARDIKPHLVRMLWSAYCSREEILAACKIGIHKFISLPYDPWAMEATLCRALEQFALVDGLVRTRVPAEDLRSHSGSPTAPYSQDRNAQALLDNGIGYSPRLDYKQFIVLVVDDQEAMLRMFDRCVGDKFRILKASSAERGVELLKEHKDEVGVLIADSWMPTHKGSWLLEQARDIKPHLVCIYWSCCPMHWGEFLEACRIGIQRFLMLPIDPETMEEAVRGAVEAFAELNELIGDAWQTDQMPQTK